MEKYYFEEVSLSRKKEILEYLDEFVEYKSDINGMGFIYNIFEGYTFEDALEICLKLSEKEYAKSLNRPCSRTLLFIRKSDNKIIGSTNIRWDLPEHMIKFGSHIGYSIRPTERRKGYSKIQLFIALLEAQKLKLDNVILACDVNNIGSNKTIKSLGGVLKKCEVDPYDNILTNLYVINVKETIDKYYGKYGNYIYRNTCYCCNIHE